MNPITGPRSPQVQGPTEAGRAPAPPVHAPLEPAASLGAASNTRISEEALALARAGQGTESGKLEALRRRIAEGSFKVDAERIAESMWVRL